MPEPGTPHEPIISPASPARDAGGGRVRARRAGFTLVEVWIGLMVTVVIAGVSLAAFRGKTKLQTLRRGQATLAADLRAMQQWSQGGKTTHICEAYIGQDKMDVGLCQNGQCPGSFDGTCVYKVPAGGFGVRVSPCSSSAPTCAYQLFADLNNDDQYNETTELLPGGNKMLESPVRTGTLRAYYVQGCDTYDTVYADVVFAAYTGSASISSSSTGCAGYGGFGTRREVITFGPAVAGSTVQIIVHSGSGGIQEQ